MVKLAKYKLYLDYEKFNTFVNLKNVKNLTNNTIKVDVPPLFLFNSLNAGSAFSNIKYKSNTELPSDLPSPASTGCDTPKQTNDPKKPSLLQRIKNEILHYYHGFRLLGLEVKIASGICFQVLSGHTLTLRERKQDAKIQQRLKAKLELTRFLQETLVHTKGWPKNDPKAPTIAEFQEFLKQLQDPSRSTEIKDITRFSKLFEDQLTLESLDNKRLKVLCKVLALSTIGTSNLLRFQIWMRIRNLKAEDQLLAKEGVNQIPPWELQSLCQDRGMRSIGLSQEQLRAQLSQWLTLHLEKNIPITLILFSQSVLATEKEDPESVLQEVIAQLPVSASEEATARVLENTPLSELDPKLKLEVLRKEQANIKAARVQRKQELAELQKAESLQTQANIPEKLPPVTESILSQLDSKKVHLDDVAPFDTITTSNALDLSGNKSKTEDQKVPPPPPPAAADQEPEISVGDLVEIESAISSSSSALQKEALHGLKEEVAQTAKAQQQQMALVSPEVAKDKRSLKAATILDSSVDRLIKDMDTMIEDLNQKRLQLLKVIELHEVQMKHSTEPTEKNEILDVLKANQDEVVDINDLLLSLKRLQKVPDDTKWQKILQVLDEDHDGKIELKHVISVIKLLGSENVKLSSKEITRVLEMIDNEHLAQVINKSRADLEAKLTEKTNPPNSAL